MKVLLDTSYLFPFLGIEIEKITNEQLFACFQLQNYEFCYVDLSIFEVAAKIIKYFVKNDEKKFNYNNVSNKIKNLDLSESYDLDFFNEKLDGLLHFDNPKRLIWYYNPLLFDLLSELRRIHSDFFDCVIFSTAVIFCNCFATMDENFVIKIKEDRRIIDLIKKYNSGFSIWMNDLKKEPFPLL